MKKIIVLLNVILLIVALLFSFTGCNANKEEKKLEIALELAGENRKELQKVLDHYQTPKDSLKLKAATFLISNMPYHSFTEIDERFNSVFRKMGRGKLFTADKSYRKSEFRKRLRNHSNYLKERDSFPINKKVNDIEVLKADFLIDNIELAFEAWYRIPRKKRASFDDFCNYILPYRSYNEPVEIDSRSKLYQKYSWVYAELDKGEAIESIIDKMATEFDYNIFLSIPEYYPYPLSISQIEKSRFGLCDDNINYWVNVFRAIGIVASKDFVSHWGNHHSNGHSWLFVKYMDKEYMTNPGSNDNLNELYKNESIPLVRRVSFKHQNESNFSLLSTNVTSTYIKTLNIKIDNVLNVDIERPVLCVFDRNKEWEIVSNGSNSWGKSEFLNVGVNVLYLAGSVNNNGEIIPLNYPFYINQNKEMHFFAPKDSIIKNATLLRKYGLSSPKDRQKVDWPKNLNSSEIQVSNDKNFQYYKTVYKIENFNSTQLQKVNFNSSEKYKYIRFKSNNREESYLAALGFYDDKKNKLQEKANLFEENLTIANRKNKIDVAFDGNPLSFCGGTDFSIGMKLDKPTTIGAIEFQARNDGNHIDEGDVYELFYWDKNWTSLGSQKAKDTVLYYDVPKNSLLWLKNHTKGKEEHVFTIDQYGGQKWLGFDNDIQNHL
ncbi:discoidin domain-containing protein [Tamlana sp. 62-3]|uniref:Discoidin domain-containing protein n=1 Tax=Neotamlana sargassicola TaxID=2883125 RepID=A0A9X1I545_9FLAO|nr:discoidin domain-containing protein [Tamlana sargassicola]MCB4807947.1 discoidin domain-containing protein [Tamlana sargassicola]